MMKLIHPFFGDLFLKGAVALSLLFVMGLILDAWWQKRQARLMREWARGQFPYSAHRVTPLRAFFKRFGKALALLLAIASITVVVLLAARKNVNARMENADDNSIAAYATNFQGDATRPLSAKGTQPSGSGDTNLSWNQNLARSGKISLGYKPLPTSGSTAASAKSVPSNTVMLPGKTERSSGQK